MNDDAKRKLNFKRARGALELDLDELAKLGNDAAVRSGMVPRSYAESVASTASEPAAVEVPPAPPALAGDNPKQAPALPPVPLAPSEATRRSRQRFANASPATPVEIDRVTAELPRDLVAAMKHAIVHDRSTIRKFLEAAIAKELAARART